MQYLILMGLSDESEGVPRQVSGLGLEVVDGSFDEDVWEEPNP